LIAREHDPFADKSRCSKETGRSDPWRIVGNQDIESHTAEERIRQDAVGRGNDQPAILNKSLAIGIFFRREQLSDFFRAA
jgi:hypothetical protein